MEAKKTSRSDLENKRFIFREIGLVVALAMVFFAFETKYYQEEYIAFTVQENGSKVAKHPDAEHAAGKKYGISLSHLHLCTFSAQSY